MATIRDVARAAGVSVTTVSRVMNGTGRISAETRSRVRAAASELKYAPNRVAQGLQAGHTATIGVLIPDISNPFFPKLVSAIEEEAHKRGYVTLLMQSAMNRKRSISAVQDIYSSQVRGLIIAGAEIASSDLEDLPDLNVVAVDRLFDGVPTVKSNHRSGAEQATSFLIDSGHKHIAHIAGPDGVSVSNERRDGYIAALKSSGMKADNEIIRSSSFTLESGYRVGLELLQDRPDVTAVFAANDLIAFGVIDAAQELDRRVPQDLSVIGFDDIEISEYFRPALTTMRQDTIAMAQNAVRMLVSSAESSQEDVSVNTEMMIRDTAGPPC